jgi:4-amino-4-deoxy-L-arabinose transferase-like glycosyltransferase
MRWSKIVRLALVLAAYLVLGSLYVLHTPAWQAPDEPAHYNYVRHVAETGSLPLLQPGDYPHAYLEEIKAARFPAHMSIAPLRYESWQPPLYYLLAAPVYRATGGSLPALRLVSLLLGAGVVGTAYAIVRAGWPEQPELAAGAAAFVAFVPMHLAMTTAVNNDVLAELLIALIAWRVLRQTAARNTGSTALVLTGLMLGLGLVTKLTVYYTALPLALIGLWWMDRRPGALVRHAALVLAPALLLVVPWLARNVTLYGWPDVLGTMNHDSVVVGQLRTGDYLAQVGWPAYLAHFATTTFNSFWGQFGWMAVPMDGRAYLLVGLLSALAAVGVVLRLLTHPRPASTPYPPAPSPLRGEGEIPPLHSVERGLGGEVEIRAPEGEVSRRAGSLLGLWLGLAVAGYLYYNVTFVQFQGRYLFPGLIPLGLLVVIGWRAVLTRRYALLAAATGLGVTALALAGGSLNRWTLGIGGGASVVLALRRWLPPTWDAWWWMLPLVGLAGLAGYSLFAYVVPNL